MVTCRSGWNLLGVLAVLGLGLMTGCQKQYTVAEMRPDPSSVIQGDAGLQSKDLIEMTDKLAPDMLKIPEIVANPHKVVIVMTGVENKTSQPWVDQTIYVHRLRALLNAHARDRLAFVEKRATTEKIQAQELGENPDPFEDASRTGQQVSTRLKPQFALKGEFLDLPRGATTYYLCTFQLTNLRTGEIVWEGHYEVRTLNIN